MAGIGAAINTGGATRGKSVAVIGCGGVGVAAIAGAVLSGASPVIAVDIDPKKLEAATKMGATHTINSSEVDPVLEIARICTEVYPGAHGADIVVEAVGRPETWKQAFYARDLAGTVVLVGVPTPDMTLPDIPLIDVFGRGGSLKSSWYGDCLPSRDFPMLIDLYQQGRLDLDAFVTEEIGIDDIEAAFDEDAPRRRAPLGRDPLMAARVDHAVCSGTFSLDGETFDVDNNIWVIGDDTECIVIDAPHSVGDILAVVGDRKVKAIVLHPRPRRPRAAWRRPCARRSSRRSCCTRTRSRSGTSPTASTTSGTSTSPTA